MTKSQKCKAILLGQKKHFTNLPMTLRMIVLDEYYDEHRRDLNNLIGFLTQPDKVYVYLEVKGKWVYEKA